MQKRIIKEYDKLSKDVKKALGVKYPFGFDEALTSMRIGAKKTIKGLFFEFDNTIYLIKMNNAMEVEFPEDTYEDTDFNREESSWHEDEEE